METKRCPSCGNVKPLESFRIDKRRHVHMPTGASQEQLYRRKVCKVCEVDRRITRREENPYVYAFRGRRQGHARTLGMAVADLKALGWDEGRRSIEMEAAFNFGYCPHCIEMRDGKAVVHFFRDMPRGLAELTIDIIDPTRPAVWPGNVQFLCDTCNKRKQRHDPVLHGQRLQAEHEFREGEAVVIDGQLGLFDA